MRVPDSLRTISQTKVSLMDDIFPRSAARRSLRKLGDLQGKPLDRETLCGYSRTTHFSLFTSASSSDMAKNLDHQSSDTGRLSDDADSAARNRRRRLLIAAAAGVPAIVAGSAQNASAAWNGTGEQYGNGFKSGA